MTGVLRDCFSRSVWDVTSDVYCAGLLFESRRFVVRSQDENDSRL